MDYVNWTSAQRLKRSDASRLKIGRWFLPLAALLCVACAQKQEVLNDDEKMVRSVLELLASQGKSICLNDETEGEALSIFREMSVAPVLSRHRLHWSIPEPLWPSAINAKTGQLHGSNDQPVPILTEPEGTRRTVSSLDEFLLNSAARRLSAQRGAGKEISIRSSWTPAGVTARWWPINGFKECDPLFAVTRPIRDRTIGFVTVRSAHWGTLYALKPVKGDWVLFAEWSRWLE